MAQPSLEAQFHGTMALTTLHLRRLAQSNDLDVCFTAAREMDMLDDEQEAFMRTCFDMDARLQAGELEPGALSPELISRMQRCILSINSADPA